MQVRVTIHVLLYTGTTTVLLSRTTRVYYNIMIIVVLLFYYHTRVQASHLNKCLANVNTRVARRRRLLGSFPQADSTATDGRDEVTSRRRARGIGLQSSVRPYLITCRTGAGARRNIKLIVLHKAVVLIIAVGGSFEKTNNGHHLTACPAGGRRRRRHHRPGGTQRK